VDREDTQPIKEIIPKSAILHKGMNILICRSDYTDIHLNASGTAEALDTPLLQYTEELCLKTLRHVPDFIEEKRAVFSKLDASRLCPVRSGKGPFLEPNSSLRAMIPGWMRN
jgi:hypothetical protein